MYNRHEVLDIVIVDGKARGVIARDLVTGKIERFGAHAVVFGYRRLWQCILPVYQCDGM